MGENRKWKKTLEAFWSLGISEKTFYEQMKNYRLDHLQKQLEKEIDHIPVGDFSFYDHVLDTATMFGLVPKCFNYDGGVVPLTTYFAMARGNKEEHACEMTKWFDTNYHLKQEKHNEYLNWAVEAFRTCTSAISDTTQIHTYMCYCDFNEIIDSIHALDADVISIETSRSHAELISAFENNIYDKGIGLGVYDIHSPRVPSEEEMLSIIERALSVLPPSLFWVNPDCGLKTRTETETVAALKNMVNSAKKARKKTVSVIAKG